MEKVRSQFLSLRQIVYFAGYGTQCAQVIWTVPE